MSKHKVTRREFDSILAALRLSQHDSAWIADGDGMIYKIAEEHGDALTNDEIGTLCEKLNWDGEPIPARTNADAIHECTFEAIGRKLLEWETQMGGFESHVWDELRVAVEHPDTDWHRAGCTSCQMAHDKALPDGEPEESMSLPRGPKSRKEWKDYHPDQRPEETTNEYLNFYRCPGNVTGRTKHKPHSWTLQHDCTCDDKCPKCNVAYSPYKSEDI